MTANDDQTMMSGVTDESPAPLPCPTTLTSEGGKPRPPLPRWTVPVVALLVTASAVVVLVALWRWIDGLALADVEKRATAQLDAVKVAASIAVGGGGLFALYLAARRQRTQESELDARHAELAQRDRVQAHAEQVAETNRLHAERVASDVRIHAEAQRVTELYAKSVEQLGADKAPVRLGGLYALERLAQDNPQQRQTVINVLCAYLRMPFMSPGEPPSDDADEQARFRYDERVQEQEVRLTAQRVLATHLRPGLDGKVGNFWPDIDLDLTGATLTSFDFARCQPRRARFDRAIFIRDAWFGEVKFTGDASFNAATFTGDARFGNSVFVKDARFNSATFTGSAWLEGATFERDAGFDAATFAANARFNETNFTERAWFNGATFTGSSWFKEAYFAGDTSFDSATILGGIWFEKTSFDGDATFEGVPFAHITWFKEVMFAGYVDFGTSVFTESVNFDGVMVSNQESVRSSWPDGWQLDAEHCHIEGRASTWQRLVKVDFDASDENQIEPFRNS